MKRTLAVFIFLFLAFGVMSQEEPYSLITEIKKQLSAQQQQQVIEAEKYINTGDNYMSQANSYQNKANEYRTQARTLKGKKKRKTLKQADELEAQATDLYIKSYTYYWNGNTKLYKIYKQNLNDLASKLSDKDKQQMLSLVQQADNSYNKGKSYMIKGKNAKDNKQKRDLYKQGVQLAKEAVELQEQAYSLYFDKTRPKPKPKPAPKPATNVAQNTKPAKQETTKPVQTKPATQTQVQTQTNQNRTISQPATKPPVTQPYTRQQSNVYFRVQVAASKVPLSAAKLQQIYPGKVYYEFDKYDRMYKYLTIEKFTTYEQAKRFKESIGVPGAFVVAYKNGQRVRDIKTVVKNH